MKGVFFVCPKVVGNPLTRLPVWTKRLYGLKQRSCSWSKLLTLALKRLGFQQCLADPCVFRLRDGKDIKMVVGVHVDDTILVSSEKDSFWSQEKLSDFFPVKHLGETLVAYGMFVRARHPERIPEDFSEEFRECSC